MKRNITSANVRTLTKKEFEFLLKEGEETNKNLGDYKVPVCRESPSSLYSTIRANAGTLVRLDGGNANLEDFEKKSIEFIFLSKEFYKNKSCQYFGYGANVSYTDKIGKNRIMVIIFSNHKRYLSWGYVPDETEKSIMDIII